MQDPLHQQPPRRLEMFNNSTCEAFVLVHIAKPSGVRNPAHSVLACGAHPKLDVRSFRVRPTLPTLGLKPLGWSKPFQTSTCEAVRLAQPVHTTRLPTLLGLPNPSTTHLLTPSCLSNHSKIAAFLEPSGLHNTTAPRGGCCSHHGLPAPQWQISPMNTGISPSMGAEGP